MSGSAFRLTVDLGSFDRQMDQMVVECDAAARPAAQAAAQVLYDEIHRRVPVSGKGGFFHGTSYAKTGQKYYFASGNLKKWVYQHYNKKLSTSGKAFYSVGVNEKRAPYAHMVEYGHLQRYEVSFDKATGRFVTHKDRPLPAPRQVAARPFIRPAMARFSAAMDAARARYLQELTERGVLK